MSTEHLVVFVGYSRGHVIHTPYKRVNHLRTHYLRIFPLFLFYPFKYDSIMIYTSNIIPL